MSESENTTPPELQPHPPELEPLISAPGDSVSEPLPPFDPQLIPPPPVKPEVFWGWHDLFLFVLITMFSLFLAMLLGMSVRRVFHLSDAGMNIVLVLAQFAAYGMAFACLKMMFQAQYDEPLMKSLRWAPVRITGPALLLIGLGQAFTIAILGAFMHIPQVDTPMNKLLADRPTAIVIAILGVTIAPLAEELAFRGLLQPLLVRGIGVVPGIFVTSLLFGAMHLEQYQVWQSVVLITLAGAGFGTMRHMTGSTRASAFMHAGYNSALFLLFFTQRGGHA